MNKLLHIRPAGPKDALAVAQFNVIADEGLPLIAWAKAAPPGVDPLDYGASRAADPTTQTGVTNTDLALLDDDCVGAACSYAIGPQSPGPGYMAPFRRLKSRFSGSWYLDFIAVREDARRQGVASRLLDAAAARGARAGADLLFLLMLDTNMAAHRAYLRAGFELAAAEALPSDRPWPPPEARQVRAYTRKIHA